MSSLLKEIKKKPRHHRSFIAFSSALLLTTLIFFAWFFAVTPQIHQEPPAIIVEENERDFISPLASLKEGFDSGLAIISQGISEFRREINEDFLDFFPKREEEYKAQFEDRNQFSNDDSRSDE